jgi:DNA-binding GntR family transcriptional regulator
MTAGHSDLLIDEAYAHLRDLILANVFQAGQKLVDRELADRLGVSRTPVREALCRLAMTGLVEKRVRHGYRVVQFSAEQVSDLYEFRAMLEAHAVKLAVQNAQKSHLREFERILTELQKLSASPGDSATAVALDLRIHDLIAEASGNESLHKAIRNVMDKVMCFISMEIFDKASLVAAHREHKALLSEILAKNADGAVKLIRKHISGAQESLVNVFEVRECIRSAALEATLTNTRRSKQQCTKQKREKGEKHGRH